ncbi:MAG: BACON domain-containing protein [Candidatus Aminicenantes bacterium]|nr:BACON domain-containing protein [Candidatus Aminicenantes bacterium]
MEFRKAFAICFITVCLIYSNAYGIENISKTSGNSVRPVVAINQNGVVLVIWLEGEESGYIYYNVYKDGNWSGTKNLTITREIAWHPQLAVDAKGNFHMAYADGFSRYTRDICHCVYDPESGWSKAQKIYTSPDNSAWQKIDIEEDRIYIVWFHQHSSPYTGADIVMTTKKVEDEKWPTAYERLSWTANDLGIHPAFKVLNDKIYITYMEGTGTEAPWRLRYKEGNRGSNWQGIPHETLYSLAYYPELEVDDERNVHVVFGNRSGNYYYRCKYKGNWKSTEVISNKHAPFQMGDITYRNNVLIASFIQSPSEGVTSVYYTKKAPKGEWQSPVEIDEGKNADYPRARIDYDGYAHFVWEDTKNAVGGNRDIFYEKIPAFPPDPCIQLSAKSLSFTIEGLNPEPVSFFVKNIGEKPFNYEVSTDQNWITVTPTSGTLGKGEENELECSIDAVSLDEGKYTGFIEISSPEAINSPQKITVELDVLAPPIYAPVNFSGVLKENRALFYREYVHHLTWEANTKNRNITKYRLYEVSGVNRILVQEVSSSTFEFLRRHVKKGKSYTYELFAVDDKDRTGEAATLIMQQQTDINKTNKTVVIY